jgi:hypothetical protein
MDLASVKFRNPSQPAYADAGAVAPATEDIASYAEPFTDGIV